MSLADELRAAGATVTVLELADGEMPIIQLGRTLSFREMDSLCASIKECFADINNMRVVVLSEGLTVLPNVVAVAKDAA